MLRIAFAGTPEFAVPALAALAASQHALVGVLTQPDRPAGRGLKLAASPVKQRALELGIPVDQPARLRSEEERAALVAWRPDLLVVVAYGLLLPPPVLVLPRLGCLNIHASLLPRWRGAAPIQRAILAGDDRSGVSLMQMDAGLDTGPVLAQRALPITAATTGGALHDALASLGAAVLLEVIADLAAGRAQPRPQPLEGATYAAKITKEEARIDWRWSADEIARQVMAFNPWPVAWTQLAGEPLRLWAAHARMDLGEGAGAGAGADAAASAAGGTVDVTTAAPGTVLGLTDGALHIRCGQGVLAVASLQRAGRRRLDAAQFARGTALAGLLCL